MCHQQVEALEHEMTQLRTEHDHYRVDMEQSLATVNAALGQKDTQLTQVTCHPGASRHVTLCLS